MKRVAIFAHYDSKNIIDDYVLYYIDQLSSICQNVIFVSCCELSENELAKLSCHKIAQSHSEYDFGSYKRGFIYAQNKNLLDDCDELIFANDSCYGPFKPLEKIFERMQKSDCDFWGLTKNQFGFKIVNNKFHHDFIPHIQSYFFVLRPQVFGSKIFIDFINSVKSEANKNSVIQNYEISMTSILQNAGFEYDYAVKMYDNYNNSPIFKWRELFVNTEFPFIKCSILRLENLVYTTIEGWKELLAENQVKLVENNLKYTSKKHSIKHCVPRIVKEFVFKQIALKKGRLPKLARLKFDICRLLLKTIFSFVTD